MAGKRVVKKKSSASLAPGPAKKKQEPRYERTIEEGRNHAARAAGDGSAVIKKPKIHAKVMTVTISVGTYDRKRNFDDFVKDVRERLGVVPYGEEGIHMSQTGGYYILDGAVCMPDDYDEKTGTFKKGAVPPQWAGGPKPQSASTTATQEQMARDAKELSSDEYDKKYKIGKYRQLGTPGARLITQDEQRAKMQELKKSKAKKKQEAEVEEEFDWDASDVSDTKKLDKALDDHVSDAITKLKSSKKKPVIKKKSSASSKKKTVRVKK